MSAPDKNRPFGWLIDFLNTPRSEIPPAWLPEWDLAKQIIDEIETDGPGERHFRLCAEWGKKGLLRLIEPPWDLRRITYQEGDPTQPDRRWKTAYLPVMDEASASAPFVIQGADMSSVQWGESVGYAELPYEEQAKLCQQWVKHRLREYILRCDTHDAFGEGLGRIRRCTLEECQRYHHPGRYGGNRASEKRGPDERNSFCSDKCREIFHNQKR